LRAFLGIQKRKLTIKSFYQFKVFLLRRNKMGYTSQSNNRRWGLPIGLLALILMMVLMGTAGAPTPAMAAAINCGECHSNPPQDSDSGGCKQTTKSHPDHSSGADLTTCDRCHPTTSGTSPTAKHNNNITNITSVVSPGMRYTGGNCTNACHKNKDAAWGGSGADCNICHFRSGATGSFAMSGLHATSDRSYMHYSSAIKVIDNTKTITCSNCHPAVPFANNTSGTRQHINTPNNNDANFKARGDMSQAHTYVSVTGIGYTKGATAALSTCALSCHNNFNDPFGNYTIYFKPGQKRYFGPYESKNWGDADLNCNECHSTPGQEATFGSLTSTVVFGNATSQASKNANKRHEAHMFDYKLNPFNFQSEDRNIYCDDCHKTPDIFAVRGFRNHSTLGEGGSGIISLPVKSQNARVDLGFRNGGIGRDGNNPATFTRGTCNNVYCHTIMVEGKWTEDACNACHGTLDGVDTGSGAPGYRNWTTPSTYPAFEEYAGGGGAHYSHVMKRGYPCRSCHYDGGGDGNPANHMEGGETVIRANVNVGVHPDYWFNNQTSYYDLTTRSCNNVKCHYGSSQNWDCAPLH
jgi:hypothetical protein